jgi:anaerobic ribonucleoside-triphosphate reductase
MTTFWKNFYLNAPLLYKIGALLTVASFNRSILYTKASCINVIYHEDVMALFKNKRATISMGYIGLYETATVFYGPNWEHNDVTSS